jgi:hypothetical protein
LGWYSQNSITKYGGQTWSNMHKFHCATSSEKDQSSQGQRETPYKENGQSIFKVLNQNYYFLVNLCKWWQMV